MMKSFSLNKVLLLFAGLFIMTSQIWAQQKSVTGIVTDANTGEVLPGVTVVIKNTTTGTITMPDGVYNINANQGDALIFSFIGYLSQEQMVGAQNTINVALKPDVIGVEEVVVIGYGSVKKDDATGSIVAISTEDFNQGAISSPQDLLVGKMSGVQITSSGGAPGAGSTIRIRGGASLSATNDPLFVIDGVPVSSDDIDGVDNPLATINPDDIETFTVLKDASATAIYGSRASNGVIIITTKKGTKGQKLSVNYSGKFSVSTVSNLIDVYGASEYKKMVEDLYGTSSAAYAALGAANTDWQKEIYKSAFGQDHNISFDGGIEDLPYRISYGYNNQDGVLKTSNIERHTLSLNLTPTYLDGYLKTSLSAKTSIIKNRFANTDAIGAALGFDPTHPVKNTYTGDEQWGGYWQWVDENEDPLDFAPNNPLALLEQENDRSTVKRAIVNLSLDYKFPILPEMSAVANLGMDYSKSEGKRSTSPNASWLYESDDIRGEKAIYDQEKTNQVLDFYLKYAKSIGEHSFDAMAGYSWQYFKDEGYDYENDFYDNRLEPKRDLPNAGENYLISYYSRVNYSFKNKYLVTGTIRRDGTSRFAENNRWGNFPSVALAWKIKNEGFLSNIEAITDLKVRLGWGITGQQDISGDNYPGYPTYTLSDNGARYIFGNTWYNTYRPNAFNPDIKWEETTSKNIGIDFGFLENRIFGSVDYYTKETKDLINKITVAAGTSFSDRIVSNVGSMENKGVEINLVGRPISTPDLLWEIGANLTYNENKITQLTAVDDPNYVGVPTGDLGSGNFIQMNSVGRPVNMFYVYEQVYDKNGKPLEGVYVDQDNNGIINSDDKIYMGNSTPDYLIGVNTQVKYKNWDFKLNGRFQLGAQVYNDVAQGSSNFVSVYSPTTRALSNKLANSADTGFKNPDEQRKFSSLWIENADFFRLDNVSIGYNFGELPNFYGAKLRVSLTGQNLFVISDYSGLDPEIFDGRDNNVFPRPTTIMLGVNIGF